MARKPDDIASPSNAWHAMEAYRELPRDLRGGVLGLQALGQKHLFKAAKETEKDYQRRKKALTLEPYYWASCEHLGGQPFTIAPRWSDDTPKLVREWEKDVDFTQRDFRSVAWTSCTASVGMGLQFLLVLWDNERNRSKILVFPAEAVLDPKEEGAPVRIRVDEYERDPDRPWLRVRIEQIMMLFDGEPTAGGEERFARYQLFEHEKRTNPKTPWKETPVEEGFLTPQETMPLFPLYTGSGGVHDMLPWVSVPALHPLAVMNRTHMNKRSDLDFGLHIANIPQRGASGLTKKEAEEITTVSYDGLWWMSNPAGKFYFVEHAGQAFDISLRDLDGLERKCEIFGLSPLLSKEAQNVTATGRLIDLSRATTTAQAWALCWEDTWLQAWRCAARYARVSDKFTMTLYTEFGPKEKDLERAKMIQSDYLQGDLDPVLYYNVMRQLGVYPEGFDAATAAAKAIARRDEMMKQLAAIPVPPAARKPPEKKPAPAPAAAAS